MRYHAFITPVLAALLLTGCAGGSVPAQPAAPGPGSTPTPSSESSTPAAVPPAGLEGSWRGIELTPGGVVAGHEPRLVLQGDRLGMRPGCNTGGGGLRIQGDRLIVDGLMSTKMGCAEPLMAQERSVGALLEAGPQWVLDGDRLTLTAGELRMVLLRDTSTPAPEATRSTPPAKPPLTPAPGQA